MTVTSGISAALSSFLLFLLLNSCADTRISCGADSPNGILRVVIGRINPDDPEKLYYTVLVKGTGNDHQIMDYSSLGIEREDARFTENLELVSVEEEKMMEDSYALLSGKKLIHHNSYNRLRVILKNTENSKMSIEFRIYDNGIAFRYMFNGKSENDVRVLKEYTGFNFRPGNFWAQAYDTITRWSPAYETYFDGPMDVGTSAPEGKNGWSFPLLVQSEDHWFLVSESGFDGSYGASHICSECDGGSYRIRFAEQSEAEGYYENTSHSTLPWETPWRFIVIGSTLHEIVENSMATDLAKPAVEEDISWIRPGRATWSWWSDSESPRNYGKLASFVDFAASMGWEYSLVDANWNLMENGSLEKLADYAESKNVGLLLWYNSGGKHNDVPEEPRGLMDDSRIRKAEFQRISNLGIKGIKVDFFQSDKQEIIKQYIDILEDAANARLLVNFHGCTLPRGWRRTYPHLVSMESVRGGECYKFDRTYPENAPHHLAIIPFTRNAIGPVDYTTGGFSNSNFPHLTTYGFELALPVLLESGIMHYTDTPQATFGLPPYAVEFLKNIPVVWDDSKYIAGYPGSEVVLARRRNDIWFIAGINGEPVEKELTIDLSPTGESPESLDIIEDGPGNAELRETRFEVRSGKVTLHLKPYGGFVGTWE